MGSVEQARNARRHGQETSCKPVSRKRMNRCSPLIIVSEGGSCDLCPPPVMTHKTTALIGTKWPDLSPEGRPGVSRTKRTRRSAWIRTGLLVHFACLMRKAFKEDNERTVSPVCSIQRVHFRWPARDGMTFFLIGTEKCSKHWAVSTRSDRVRRPIVPARRR